MSNKEIVGINLNDIHVTHNPRCPVRNLMANLGEETFKGEPFPENTRPLDLVRNLALSDNAEDRAEFVRLIEKHEWRDANGEIDPESVVELAASLAHCQIEPIMVRRYTALQDGVHQQRFGVIVGERRVIATAYNYAKHGIAPVVQGTIVRMTLESASTLAWEENRRRKAPSDMEVARYFHALLEERKGEINPETGRKWTMRQVAMSIHEDYQEFRRHEALVYLPEGDQRRLEAGLVGKSAAIEKALKIKMGKEDEPIDDKKTNRRRVMTLREVETLFDQTDLENTTYLQALADVMEIPLRTAVAESKRRRKGLAEAA